MVDSVGSIAASDKFVFFSYLANVVLLVINKTQSPGCRCFNIISNQGGMMEAMNLRTRILVYMQNLRVSSLCVRRDKNPINIYVLGAGRR